MPNKQVEVHDHVTLDNKKYKVTATAAEYVYLEPPFNVEGEHWIERKRLP